MSLQEIERMSSQPQSDYSLLEILKSETIFSNTNQRMAIMKPSGNEDCLKMLLLTKNKFIYKNKDSFILNVTDLTNLKRVD